MVLTANQTTAFFESVNQMELANCTRVYLQTKSIITVENLEEFVTKESWVQVIENCKRPPKIPDPSNPAGPLIEQKAFRIGAKSLKRLKVAAKCIAYYINTGRDLTAAALM